MTLLVLEISQHYSYHRVESFLFSNHNGTSVELGGFTLQGPAYRGWDQFFNYDLLSPKAARAAPGKIQIFSCGLTTYSNTMFVMSGIDSLAAYEYLQVHLITFYNCGKG